MGIASIGNGLLERAASRPSQTPSAAGKSFASMLRSASASGVDAGKSASAVQDSASLERSAQSQLSELSRTLRQLLSDVGIDTSEPIRLQPDGRGGVRLSDVHADWPEIQRILDTNPDLGAKLQELAALYEKIRADEAQPVDDAAFRKTFTLTLIDDQARVSFE